MSTKDSAAAGLLSVNPAFQLPETLEGLKAIFWANVTLCDALTAIANRPSTQEAVEGAADLDTPFNDLYRVQGKIFAALMAMPIPEDVFARQDRAEMLLRYASDCGLFDHDLRILETAERLSSLHADALRRAEEAAANPLAIAAE